MSLLTPLTVDEPRRAASMPMPPLNYEHFHKSQEHLLKPTASNPQPTTMPPPSAQLAGLLGKRQVISFIGLPARGKPFLAERLCHYMSFFHGVRCRTFDISEKQYHDDNVLFDHLTSFLESEDEAASCQVMAAIHADFSPNDGDEAPGSPIRTAKSAPCGHRRSSSSTTSPVLRSSGCGSGSKDPSLDDCAEDLLNLAKKNVDSGRVAIVYSKDAIATHRSLWSGSTKDSRYEMQQKVASLSFHYKILFVEVVVTDQELVRKFITQRQLSSFQCEESLCAAGFDGATKLEERDLEHLVHVAQERIKEYSRKFVTLQEDGSEDDVSYIKLINYGQKVITNNARGLLVTRVARFLTSVHPRRHVIYLTRHGQSTYNVAQKIGGNPGLSPAGEKYATWLGSWVPKNICQTDEGVQQPCRLWTSSMKRTIETARHIPHPVIRSEDGSPWEQMMPRVFRNLDEIFAGEYEGMTYSEIEKAAEQEARLRKVDKLGYRYPRGESYYDLISRLNVLVHDLELYHEPLLIVSHQATLRVMYAYLKGIPRTEAPGLEIPLHTVIRIEYDGFGLGVSASEERIPFSDEAIGPDGQKCL
jgi:broad specificity phosphatase PhoE